ncbi:hypothetical protein L218DRAFT_95853 [Marasmius fiardii PR-910]|nr:hypothetical protein L218DRAFT_95853 [Marasmius fiardii PR-910]
MSTRSVHPATDLQPLTPLSYSVSGICNSSGLIADALSVFIYCFTTVGQKNKRHYELVSETGIIQIGRKTLTMLEKMKLEHEKPVPISYLLNSNKEDLELYSRTYKTTTGQWQPYPVHAVRWNLIVLEKQLTGTETVSDPTAVCKMDMRRPGISQFLILGRSFDITKLNDLYHVLWFKIRIRWRKGGPHPALPTPPQSTQLIQQIPILRYYSVSSS